MRILLTVFLVLGLASWVQGQTPFSGCGFLVGDSSGFPDCVHLMPDAGGGPLQLNGNLGSYEVGDYVRVEGTEFTLCATFCWDLVGCIDVDLIEDCMVAPTFAECGTLVDAGGCTLLETASGDTYELEDLGAFGVGNSVFVEGVLDAMCVPACPASAGCILANTIEICPGTNFVRGDVNIDGTINLVDCIFILNALFISGSDQPPCQDSADTTDDGAIGLADGIASLNALFGMQVPLPGPSTCGPDPTADMLDCSQTACP